jgi:hypothetical protein
MADAAKRAGDAFLDDDFDAAEELFTEVGGRAECQRCHQLPSLTSVCTLKHLWIGLMASTFFDVRLFYCGQNNCLLCAILYGLHLGG